MHLLTRDEKAALRQFYLPPYPEGWVGVFVQEQHLRGQQPMRVLYRLRLIETYGRLHRDGSHFRLTETGVQVRELMNRGEDIAVGEPPRLPSEPVEINNHNYLDNVVRSESAYPEPTTNLNSEPRVRAAFEMFAWAPSWRVYACHVYRNNRENYAQLRLLEYLGYAEVIDEQPDDAMIHARLTSSGESRRHALLTAQSATQPQTEEATSPPIQAGQRRLRNRNKK